jgi:hypothetical protein
MTAFRSLVALGATVIILHHKGKARSEGPTPPYRGSSEIAAACDIGFSIEKKKSKIGYDLILDCFKSRFNPEAQLKFHFDAERKLILPSELPIMNTDEQKLYDAIQKAPGFRGAVYSTMTGINENSTSSLLKSGDGVKWRSEKVGKSILWYPFVDSKGLEAE